jgi:16S rRNA (cytidine1402-2'-O)-methyltransferase
MGTLYVVATPIGNLEDVSERALRVLREAGLIAAEDTRHTRKLLTHYHLSARLISYHEHNKLARLDVVLNALAVGSVALVSDAGTPALSDPGEELVRAALDAGHSVSPVPGPSAALAALVVSGLPTDRFTFVGFLPRRSADRRAELARLRALPHTLIFYEAPHRLLDCLRDVQAELGDRAAVLARELTKLHEEVLRGTLASLLAHATEAGPRGEYTLVVAGASPTAEDDTARSTAAAEDHLRRLLAGGHGTREAADLVARTYGMRRRDVYRLALEIAASDSSGSGDQP